MAEQPERAARRLLSDVVRTRIRMQIAAEGLTHEVVARRMSAISGRRVSRPKVSEVLRGGATTSKPRLDEIPVWAQALNTSGNYKAHARILLAHEPVDLSKGMG